MTRPRIPRGAPGTVPTKKPTPAGERALAITPSQAQLLGNLQNAITAAQDRMNAAVSAILGQYDVASAQVVGGGGTPEKPTLIVRLTPVTD